MSNLIIKFTAKCSSHQTQSRTSRPPSTGASSRRCAVRARGGWASSWSFPSGTARPDPVWNRTPGKATDFDAVHAATEEFLARFDFPDTALDDTGALYRARDPKSGDELSFDCSFNTLELSFGPDEDLTAVHARFLAYYPALQEAFNRRGHALTGMGINPRWRENRQEPIGNGRYRMLLHHLKSYSKYGGAPRFHDHPDFGLFSCASQAQVDVCEDTVVPTINAFNALEPFKAVLLANSPFGDQGEFLCGRDQLWSHSLHGLNPHNCGMYGVTLRSLADLVGYLESTSIYCTERSGWYLNFEPVPLTEYIAKGTIVAEYWAQLRACPADGVHRQGHDRGRILGRQGPDAPPLPVRAARTGRRLAAAVQVRGPDATRHDRVPIGLRTACTRRLRPGGVPCRSCRMRR